MDTDLVVSTVGVGDRAIFPTYTSCSWAVYYLPPCYIPLTLTASRLPLNIAWCTAFRSVVSLSHRYHSASPLLFPPSSPSSHSKERQRSSMNTSSTTRTAAGRRFVSRSCIPGLFTATVAIPSVLVIVFVVVAWLTVTRDARLANEPDIAYAAGVSFHRFLICRSL